MEITDNYLFETGLNAGIPLDQLVDSWETGKDIQIPANVVLNSPTVLGQGGLFIQKGCVREYFLDKRNQEHTMRILPAPSLIMPSLPEVILNKPGRIVSHSVTALEGRIFSQDAMYNAIARNTLFYKLITNQIAIALIKKTQNGIKRNQLSAKELYLDFLETYPGVVNQMPLKHIASYLNIAPETISRIRTELSNLKQ